MDLDTGLPVLRDASAGWIWEGYKAVQVKELILKSWSMCVIRGGRNISYACMTSFETNQTLVNLKHDKPELWNDLQTKSTHDYCPGDDEAVLEDLERHEDEEMGNDNSKIPTREVFEYVITKRVHKGHQQKQAGGSVGLVSSGDTEDVDTELPAEDTSDEEAAPKGRGMRTRRPNTKYAGEFGRHNNSKDQNIPVPGIELPLSTK
ncbi:hypothetical protein DFH09DRAFT_1092565 [Mycena vulgaris]|nr:hypothetical protein DFH09DRAFT_1092565 [Mycena vulgaris]